MKTAKRASVIIFFTGLLLLSTCALDDVTETGVAVFNVSIIGYAEIGEKEINIDMAHQSEDETANQQVRLLSDNTTSGYFSDLQPGSYDVTVTFLNDEKIVGSHNFSVEVLPDETTKNKVTGTYENGELIFNVYQIGADGETSISIENLNVVLVEERRDWDGSKTSPEQITLILGKGVFDTVVEGDIIYPDSSHIHLENNSFRELSYSVSWWDDQWFEVERNNYLDTGLFQVQFNDVNELGDSETFASGIDSEGISAPEIIDIQTSPVTISWSFQNSAEIEKILIYDTNAEEDPMGPYDPYTQLYHSSKVDPSDSPQSWPDMGVGVEHELFIIAVDEDVPLPDPGYYERDPIINALIWNFNEPVHYVGIARLRYTP